MATKSKPVIYDPKLSTASRVFDTTKLPSFVSGDYLMILVTWYGSRTVSSLTAGWSHTDLISASSAGVSHSVIYIKATGTTEASPTLTLSASATAILAAGYVIKGADSTNFLDGGSGVGYATALEDAGTATSLTTGSLTPVSDNSLIFAVGGILNDSALRFLQSDLVGDVLQTTGSALLTQVIGYKQQTTAAADGGFVMYSNRLGTTRSSCLTIAIRDDGNNTRVQDCRTGTSRISWYGAFGTNHDSTAWAAAAPSTMAGGNLGAMGINGIAVSTTNLAAPIETGISLINDWGGGTSIAPTENAEVWSGKYHTFAAKDLSTSLFSINWMFDSVMTLVGDEGLIVVYADSSNQWVAFQLSKKLGILTRDPHFSVIDLPAGAVYDKSANYGGAGGAAIDWINITECGYFVHRIAGGVNSRAFHIKDGLLHPKAGYVLVGGSASAPLTPAFLQKAVTGWGYNALSIVNPGSAQQMTARFPVQYGDGTVPTYFDANGSSFEYPVAYNNTAQREFNAPENSMLVNVKAKAGDTMFFKSCAMSAGAEQDFEIDAASSTSATYGFSGAAINKWKFTDNAGIAIPNATYTGGDTVHLKGNATNVRVLATTSTNAALSYSASGAVLDSCETEATSATAYHLELTSGVDSITLTDHIFTGSAGTNKIHALKAAATVAAGAFVTGDHYEIKTVGTTDFTLIGASANTIGVRFTATGAGSGTGDAYAAVKITVSGTTSLVEADVTSAGAEIWVAAPQPTLDAVVLANTRAVLWNRTTSAELDNTFVAGTAWSKVITSGASSGDILDLYTFKEGYAEARSTIIYSGDDATFAVEQAVDASIAYYRTTESITDYTTLTEYNFYAPDIYIQADDADGENTLKRLFIFYNGVLTTEDGARYMRGGVTFNSPFDVVINRSVRAIAVDNVSVTHGLHFTDEDVIRVTTDDGTSWIAPPSAPGSIRYAFGVAPGQINTSDQSLNLSTAEQALDNKLSSIASTVLTSAATTPIAANVKKVNDVSVGGTGDPVLDPWGPV